MVPGGGGQLEFLLSDLHDNYRLFNLWETMLHQPIMFSDQLVFQLDSGTQNLLIEKYYALDSAVVRELLGKKFSSRLRKDLDFWQISEFLLGKLEIRKINVNLREVFF